MPRGPLGITTQLSTGWKRHVQPRTPPSRSRCGFTPLTCRTSCWFATVGEVGCRPAARSILESIRTMLRSAKSARKLACSSRPTRPPQPARFAPSTRAGHLRSRSHTGWSQLATGRAVRTANPRSGRGWRTTGRPTSRGTLGAYRSTRRGLNSAACLESHRADPSTLTVYRPAMAVRTAIVGRTLVRRCCPRGEPGSLPVPAWFGPVWQHDADNERACVG